MKTICADTLRIFGTLLVAISMVCGGFVPNLGCPCAKAGSTGPSHPDNGSQSFSCPSCQEGQGCCCTVSGPVNALESDQVQDPKCSCVVFFCTAPGQQPFLPDSENQGQSKSSVASHSGVPMAWVSNQAPSQMDSFPKHGTGSPGPLVIRLCRLTI